jgi:ABC-type phosphate/phosphonate transport system substrate-binding protein
VNRRSAISAISLACLSAAGRWGRAGAADTGSTPRLRFVISSSTLNDVNDNDARAAMTVWAETVGKRAGIDVQCTILSSAKALEAARNGAVDGMAANAVEYRQLEPFLDPSMLVVNEPYAAGGEEYIIVVNEDGPVRDLAGLRGRPLTVYRHPSTCVAAAWLDTLLAAAKLGLPETFLGPVTQSEKLSKAVLPVYFRQSEACLVTRRGFNTMCEMNPQLEKKLRVVAASPKLLPLYMAFHRRCDPGLKSRLVPAMLSLHTNTAARQIFALFQAQRLVSVDVAAIRSASEVLLAAERLRHGSARRETQ